MKVTFSISHRPQQFVQALLENSDGGIVTDFGTCAQPEVLWKLICGLRSLLKWLFSFYLRRKRARTEKKSCASVGLPSRDLFSFSCLVGMSKYYLDSSSSKKENNELQFMKQEDGFLCCYCL